MKKSIIVIAFVLSVICLSSGQSKIVVIDNMKASIFSSDYALNFNFNEGIRYTPSIENIKAG